MIAAPPAAVYPAPASPQKIFFWNAQRISDASEETKRDVANALRAYNHAILCEGVGDLEEFVLMQPIVGATHPRKLRMHVASPAGWTEIDTMRRSYEDPNTQANFEWYRGLMNVPRADALDVALRRPLVVTMQHGGNTWGLAALHAPAGGVANGTNLTTLFATMLFLRHHFGDRWVLFGDLNLDPTLQRALNQHGAGQTLINYWLLSHYQHLTGQAVAVVQGGVTHRSGHVLDYALCPAARAANVTVRVGGDYVDPEIGPSDHAPILVTVALV